MLRYNSRSCLYSLSALVLAKVVIVMPWRSTQSTIRSSSSSILSSLKFGKWATKVATTICHMGRNPDRIKLSLQSFRYTMVASLWTFYMLHAPLSTFILGMLAWSPNDILLNSSSDFESSYGGNKAILRTSSYWAKPIVATVRIARVSAATCWRLGFLSYRHNLSTTAIRSQLY